MLKSIILAAALTIAIILVWSNMANAQMDPDLDTVVGVYCKKELIGLFVLDAQTNLVITAHDKEPRETVTEFNNKFKDWIKDHYDVKNANSVMFNSTALKDSNCSFEDAVPNA